MTSDLMIKVRGSISFLDAAGQAVEPLDLESEFGSSRYPCLSSVARSEGSQLVAEGSRIVDSGDFDADFAQLIADLERKHGSALTMVGAFEIQDIVHF